MSNQKTIWSQFIPLVSVFFFWGFIAASNDILIPVFKEAFQLTQGQSQLVSLAFYIAYTVGSLIYLGISALMGKDLINRLGYKNSLAIGLFISALGTLLFIPAANLHSYSLMLSGLFIVGLGFSLQQTVANPLAIALGDPQRGSQRLTLAGGVNNFGTTIGPLIVSFAIFGSINENSTHHVALETVKNPYLIIGVLFLVVAIFLKFSKLPDKPQIIEEDDTKKSHQDRKSALSYPQLWLGMIAIFLYVGVEVSTVSNLPEYMHKDLGFKIHEVAPYVSLYWASMMIGRWSGAVEAFSLKKSVEKYIKLIAPYLAFGVFLLVNYIGNHDLQPFYIYALIILVLIIADLLTKGNPVRMLFIFSCFGALAIITGMLSTGMVSVYAFSSVGLFCSTLWPCIFTIAIAGLGKNTSQGSSLLIMMIMGGGIISYLQGLLADAISIHFSYIVGVVCFGYLIAYSILGQKILAKQNIVFENK
ncbi:MFS transporter [Weeksella virosa]|uniref:Major facilitator superfamily MFS_1 n=1 Tax=Weeksella virosa (strain ATCC 43766 / DSM 16922 / JCM 21250 / CCUG 30538 / CDC 9751 / IAM 14551 / NBRC 16016 / NCTC 11634 / CL345/78) TaxID=865938 RepID=F0P1V2_WEEVC|nr:MFS transporter [Weeksella virosa]ADX68749.1 major facilitator superfamily MFS_1 [Weeksella virosa DSM 16922]VEH63580.1 L-fucose permease [Weeksella virosa]